LLDAYGKAFTEKDDVCLILKAKDKPVTAPFEVSLGGCLNAFYQKYPKHAEVKMLSTFIDDMSQLYRSIDATFTMSLGEGFYFPGLESIAAGKLAIAPDVGGHIDFLNDGNALLIGGKEERANPRSMYWDQNPNAIWYRPDVDTAVERLRCAYETYECRNKEIDKRRESVYNEYDWGTIATKFTSLCK
jgi:glycosyltransferase involved in cell wall biosynthesis